MTPAPLPPGAIVFSEDFEAFEVDVPWKEGSTQGQWQVEPVGSGKVEVVRGESKSLALTPSGATELRDASVSVVTLGEFGDFDLELLWQGRSEPRASGGIEWHVTSEGEGYGLWFSLFSVELVRLKAAGGPVTLASKSSSDLKTDEPTLIRVTQVGGQIDVRVRGVPLFSVSDKEPLRRGKLRLLARPNPARVDEIVVRVP